ncbi:hypothetical protein [Streptomyces abikoensis]|uniref:hypothetical protein n=1 Tax=Streptomyces abikoensis TaxID=97398 RepID=UPI0036AA819D
MLPHGKRRAYFSAVAAIAVALTGITAGTPPPPVRPPTTVRPSRRRTSRCRRRSRPAKSTCTPPTARAASATASRSPTPTRIFSPGNLGGTKEADLLARDKSGVLWLYKGNGQQTDPFESRVRIGGGWDQYNNLF